ncbi:MAG: hypothetical protein HY908_30715 [Myxococcales bacterium]|nr:hypothetical protein [Myxococcales bacterium]
MRAHTDAAAGGDARAERAAIDTVRAGGTAIDALVAGFLAAAAHDPNVLCAPVVALFGGVGSSTRCLDGRALQPGRGAARPRGFAPDVAPPPAASAAVPRSFALLAALHAFGARRSLTVLAREAATAARQAGAPERGTLIASLGRHGGGALAVSVVQRTLLRAAGPAAAGLLGEADLAAAAPDDIAVEPVRLPGGLEAAWVSAAPRSVAAARSTLMAPRILVAADPRGQVGALCYLPDPDGLPVPELEITLPRIAHPVRRGVRRVAPGTVLDLPAALAVLRRGGWFAALGAACDRSFDRAAVTSLTVAPGTAAPDGAISNGGDRAGLEALATEVAARGVWLAASERRTAVALTVTREPAPRT